MKKSYYSLIVFACLLAFSCASAPKKTAAENTQNAEEKEITEGVETENPSEEMESTPEVPEEKISEENIPDLSEEREGENSEEGNGEDEELPSEPVAEDSSDVESLEENVDIELPPETDESAVTEENPYEEKTEEKDNDKEAPVSEKEVEKASENQGEQASAEENKTDENAEGEEESSESEEEDFGDDDEHLIPVSEIKPSRSMTINKYQVLDVSYPGQGWIYQGCIDSEGKIDIGNKNFVFYGRKLGGNEQQFSLMARIPGKYFLHFFKSDVLTGSYIDDYLEVEILDSKSSAQKHVQAPSYAKTVPPKATITSDTIKRQKEYEKMASEKRAEERASEIISKSTDAKKNSSASTSKTSDSGMKTVISNSNSGSGKTESGNSGSEGKGSSSVEKDSAAENSEKLQSDAANSASSNEKNQNNIVIDKVIDVDKDNQGKSKNKNLSSDAILAQAKKLYDEKNYSGALDSINSFFEKASSRIDEALYLQGQILEAKSDVQNIKGAIESYDLLIKNYPASSLWNQANKRSIFLKRFYINIR